MPSSTPSIGDFRQLASLQAATRMPDEGGGASLVWSEVAQVWCALRPLSGGEDVASDRLVPTQRHEVWLRWRDGVTADMRLVVGDRLLDIRAIVDPDGYRHFLRLVAEEKR